MSQVSRVCGPLALFSFVLAATLAGANLDGYSHRGYPLAYLGARGVPGAFWFNAFAFAAPGLLVFAAIQSLRAALPAQARWPARIGAQTASLSALAFAAMGLFPLDAADPSATANGLHAAAWTLWWIAFTAAAALFALGGVRRTFTLATVAAALAVLALALPGWPGAMAAWAPRFALAVWLGWAAAFSPATISHA